MSKLIIVRHHESEWNKLGLWTGLTDVHITDYGVKKSEEMGLLLKATLPNIHIDYAFTSKLARTIETLSYMFTIMGIDAEKIPTEHVAAINERDYGDYTGKNKWDMEKAVGKDEFDNIRRNWDCPVPHGETLKMVAARSIPFFTSTVMPLLQKNKNVFISSHGNTIRTLVKHIENIPDEKIKDLEIPFGSIIIYDFDSNGKVTDKKMLRVDSTVNA